MVKHTETIRRQKVLYFVSKAYVVSSAVVMNIFSEIPEVFNNHYFLDVKFLQMILTMKFITGIFQEFFRCFNISHFLARGWIIVGYGVLAPYLMKACPIFLISPFSFF